MDIKKVGVLGKAIYLFRNQQHMLEYLKTHDQGILISLNIEAMSNKNNDFERIINNNIGYIDGIGLLLPLQLKGHFNLKKIPGVELWQNVVRNFPEKSVFLIGATEEVIKNVAQRFRSEFPNELTDYRNGFFSSAHEIEQIKNRIVETRPEIVLVAQGQPAQEKLAEELITLHPALYLCIGGSFDIYAGIKKRAPKLFISIGAEWLYRLYKEPQRFTRMLKSIKTIPLIILAKESDLNM